MKVGACAHTFSIRFKETMVTRIPLDKIDGYLQALNAYYPRAKWRIVSAGKDHIDDLGNPIKDNEDYYARNISSEFTSNAKLSKKSMQLYLSLIFVDSVDLYETAKEKADEQFRNLPRL